MSSPASIIDRAVDVSALGPTADAGWTDLESLGALEAQGIVAIPDAANQQRRDQGLPPIYYYRLRQATIARNVGNTPAFGLTLMVTHDPPPDEHQSISELIVGGNLHLDATLSPLPGVVDSGQATCRESNAELKPLFIKSSEWVLHTRAGDAADIAKANASGAVATASLATHVDADTTRSIVAALRGEGSQLALKWTITYRAMAAPSEVRVQGQWARIHDHLVAQFPDGYLTQAQLRSAFERLLAEGLLTAESLAEADSTISLDRTVIETLFPGFRRSAYVLLSRESTHLSVTDPENVYQLRARPDPAFEFTYVETVTGDRTVELSKEIDLRSMFEQALGDYSWDAFVDTVVIQSETGQPREVRRKSQSRSRRSGTVHQPIAVAMPQPQIVAGRGQQAAIESNLSTGVSTASPAVLAASDAAKPVFVQGSISYWAVADTLLVTNDDRRSLPVVGNAGDSLWPDRKNSRIGWYAPEYELVLPQSNATAADSPFTFRFIRAGVTSAGEPGLDGTVVFALRKRRPNPVEGAISSGRFQQVREIRAERLTIHLSIPFRDEHGQTKRYAFPAELTTSGDEVQASVAVVNDWVRLTYGALAYPGFQTESAQVRVAFAFEGYYELPAESTPFVYGGKTAILPVAYNANETARLRSADAAVLDAVDLVYHDAFTSTQLRKESAENVSRSRRPPGQRPVKVGLPIIKPPLKPAKPPRKKDYGLMHYFRQQLVDISIPCSAYGAVYVETVGGEERAAGCIDALRLGEIEYRMYEELGELASDRYRVYRSLQQPGRFLVLPSSYRISRLGPDAADPFRPMLIVYSALDPATPDNNRVVFDVGLEPNLAPYERAKIRADLRAYAASPVLEYPTEIESDTSYTWALPTGVVAEQFRMPNGFRVALKSDLASALLLREMLESPLGISGSVSFATTDGSSYRSNLDLGIRSIVGPWASGPVIVEVTGTDEVQLTNRIEVPIDVAAVLAYSADGVLQTTAPVEESISSNDRVDISITDLDASDLTFADYSVTSDTSQILTEQRVFVEDVFTNIIFVNLINLQSRDLIAIVVDLEIPKIGVSRSETLDSGNGTAEINIVLPLFSYVASVEFQFRINLVSESSTSAPGPWIDWDLQSGGHVISITPEMIN